MRTIIANPSVRMELGHAGESGVTTVVFDVIKEWQAEVGTGGTLQLLVQMDRQNAYPAAVELQGENGSWVVTAAETVKSGDGQAQLSYLLGGKIAKSALYRYTIRPSLEESAGAPPEHIEPWYTHIEQVAEEAHTAAIDAQNSATNSADRARAEADRAKREADRAAAGGGGGGGTIVPGAPGKSAYEIAVQNGFVGSEAQWLASFQGENGGYYTPKVSQPSSDQMDVAFMPSKAGMPAVATTRITLPKAPGGGGSGGAVESVNGMTGAVQLKAQDIPNAPVVTLSGSTLRFESIVDVTDTLNQMDTVIGGA